MNIKNYLLAKGKFTHTRRDPIEFDILATGLFYGAEGFTQADIKAVTGQTANEVRSEIESMIERGLLEKFANRFSLTIEGEERARIFFKEEPSQKYFIMSMGWLSKLVDSDRPSDFRNANAFLAKVKSETGQSYD